MMNQTKNIRFLSVVSLLALLVPAGASATISAFNFLGIDGGSCSLSDRLGVVSGSTEHVINIQDCSDFADCTLEIKWGLDRTPASGSSYTVKVSLPGGACVDTDITTTGDTCMTDALIYDKAVSSPNYMTFTIPFSYLTGPDCSKGWDKSTKIYLILKESGSDLTSETITFDVDLERPDAPEIDEPDEGDSNITVKWQGIEDSSDSTIEYYVYWDDSSFSNATRTNASVAGPMSGTSYQIEDLTNDVTYYYAVSALDENDNESQISVVSAAMPINVSDFWEKYREAGGTDDGGFCFLATAAWGSYMAPEVRTLRTFRDGFLMTNPAGRAFVKFYYRVSPPLASAISKSPVLRAATRLAIAPLVVVARAMTSMPPMFGWIAAAALLMLLAFTLGVAVRSRRRS